MMLEARMKLHFEVQEFLLKEADLLDRQAYQEWLEMLTDDVLYWAPAVESVEHRHRTSNRVGEVGETAYFEDSRATLGMRVARLGFPGAWAEVPPSRTRHYITNILVMGEDETGISVKSNFFVFRSRLEAEEDEYFGSREDVIIRSGSSLKLSKRKIILAQAVLTSRSITTFF